MRQIRQRIGDFYSKLQETGLLMGIEKRIFFPDEPKMHIYTATITTDGFSDGKKWKGRAGGFSFFSQELALLKCLCESGERFSNAVYRNRCFSNASFNELSQLALDPSLVIEDRHVRKKKIAWVTGLS